MKKFKIFGKMIPVFVLALLVLGVTGVTAALLTYYGIITSTVTVAQSVLVDGVDYTYGEITDSGGLHNLMNNADIQAPVRFETTCSGESVSNCNGITTTYIGNLELTKKTVDFNEDVWVIPTSAEKVQVEYTIVGNTFSAEVTNPITGYELIYYKDNSDRFNSPAAAIKMDVLAGNLPYSDDRNSEADGTYDYCSTEEYDTCHGAKIWYVPSNAINSGNTLDWSRADEFYFETELIQYNSNGEVIVYPGEILDFTIVNDFDIALKPDTYTITTNIAPV